MDDVSCDECGVQLRWDESQPYPWLYYGAAFDGEADELRVSDTAGGYRVAVRLPRALNFCSRKCAAEWFSTAISEHIHRTQEDDT